MVKWDSSLTGKIIAATAVVLGSSPNCPTKVLAQLEEFSLPKGKGAGSSPGTPFFPSFKGSKLKKLCVLAPSWQIEKGVSSIGRALALQARGCGFESSTPLFFKYT